MEKSIATAEYRTFLVVLRRFRTRAGLTQVELAERIAESQSFVSKIERGEIRLDVIQLRTICLALETDLARFTKALERELGGGSSITV
jgi:transcriptional regulator with XRE-family HTH domain